MTPTAPEVSGQRITLIAAYARDRVIGHGLDIPWHSREDFAHFKANTMGHTLVMGRITYDTIGRPLPGRRTIVVTRDPAWSVEGVDVAHSFEQALELAGDVDVYVAGGAQIYELALPHATHQVLTEMHVDAEGDVFYPEFDLSQWQEVRREPRPDLDPPLEWVWWEKR